MNKQLENVYDAVFAVIITKSLRFISEHRTASGVCRQQTKPISLSLESVSKLLSPTSTIATYYSARIKSRHSLAVIQSTW